MADNQSIPDQYAIPPGYSIQDNINQAYFWAASHTRAYEYLWFYEHVKSGGVWDYKQQGMQYEGIGNFNYGAIGTAMGIPEQTLLRMAGLAQLKEGTSTNEWGNPFGGSPYGDDPKDQQAIKDGVKWAGGQASGIPNSYANVLSAEQIGALEAFWAGTTCKDLSDAYLYGGEDGYGRARRACLLRPHAYEIANQTELPPGSPI